eukprot:g11298.t1
MDNEKAKKFANACVKFMDELKKKVGTNGENKHMKDLENIFNNGTNIEKKLDFAKNFYDTCKLVLSTIDLPQDKKVKMMTLSVLVYLYVNNDYEHSMWQKAIRLNVNMEDLVIYDSFVALRGSKLLQSIKESSNRNNGPNTILTAVQGGATIGINDVDLNSNQVVHYVNEENIAKSIEKKLGDLKCEWKNIARSFGLLKFVQNNFGKYGGKNIKFYNNEKSAVLMTYGETRIVFSVNYESIVTRSNKFTSAGMCTTTNRLSKDNGIDIYVCLQNGVRKS